MIVPLLTGSLVLAAVLAYEAINAASAHRAAAESTLRDHAAAAAWQFSRTAHTDLQLAVTHAFRRFSRIEDRAPTEWMLPDAADYNIPGPGECVEHCPSFRPVRHFFAWDHGSDTLLLDGRHAPDGFEAWVRDSLRAQISEVYQETWPFAIVSRHDGAEETVVVYQVVTDCGAEGGQPLRTLGFEADLSALGPLFDRVRRKPLLPPTLIEEAAADSLVSVAVLGLGGSLIYDGGVGGPPDFTAEDWLPAMLGGFSVELGLNRQIASHLIIGGLPRSRVPFLLATVLFTAGLIVVAVGLMRREAELVRIRSEFVAGVSHELRTPLAQIRMFAETLLLRRVRSTDEERRSLAVIDQEARRLSQLVENVLLFSKVENGSTVLRLREQPVGPVVQKAVASFAPIASARQVELTCRIDDGLVADLDQAVFGQVILNLLDNAVKYGPTGQEVVVSLEKRHGNARLTVEDQGPGIDPARRVEIWKPFVRLASSSEAAGSGIGLSVVRRFTALHGGEAWVEDGAAGARFVVEIPLVAPSVPTGGDGVAGLGVPIVRHQDGSG